LLILKVAEKYVRKFLKEEQIFLEDLRLNEEEVELIGLEEGIEYSVTFGKNKITLYGKIDRLDRIGDSIRIIDYKTGKVLAKDLNLKSWDDLKSPNKNKAFQLLFYAYLIAKSSHKNKSAITAGIISFRGLSEGVIPVKFQNNEELTTETIEQFESQLFELIKEINNPDLPFVQTDDLDVCKNCEFNRICNR
jgi:ATP-dependent helicase/DNAse subunit B